MSDPIFLRNRQTNANPRISDLATDSQGNVWVIKLNNTGRRVRIRKFDNAGNVLFGFINILSGGQNGFTQYHIRIDSQDRPVVVGFIPTGTQVVIARLNSDGTSSISQVNNNVGAGVLSLGFEIDINDDAQVAIGGGIITGGSHVIVTKFIMATQTWDNLNSLDLSAPSNDVILATDRNESGQMIFATGVGPKVIDENHNILGGGFFPPISSLLYNDVTIDNKGNWIFIWNQQTNANMQYSIGSLNGVGSSGILLSGNIQRFSIINNKNNNIIVVFQDLITSQNLINTYKPINGSPKTIGSIISQNNIIPDFIPDGRFRLGNTNGGISINNNDILFFTGTIISSNVAGYSQWNANLGNKGGAKFMMFLD